MAQVKCQCSSPFMYMVARLKFYVLTMKFEDVMAAGFEATRPDQTRPDQPQPAARSPRPTYSQPTHHTPDIIDHGIPLPLLDAALHRKLHPTARHPAFGLSQLHSDCHGPSEEAYVYPRSFIFEPPIVINV